MDKKGNNNNPFIYSTGIDNLDSLLGGGLTEGTIVGISGEEGAGKTTFLLQISLAIIKKYDKKVLYLDINNGVSQNLLIKLGLYKYKANNNNLLDSKFFILSPSTVEDVNYIMAKATKDKSIALIVIDTDTNLIDQDQDQDKTKNKNPYYTWKNNSKKIYAMLKKTKACLLLAHESRIINNGFKYVARDAGYKSFKHISSVEIWLSKGKNYIDENKNVSNANESRGFETTIRITKNRLNNTHNKINGHFLYEKGFIL